MDSVRHRGTNGLAATVARLVLPAILIFLVVAATGVSPVQAESRDVVLMRDRILRLEQQLETMRQLLERRPATAAPIRPGAGRPSLGRPSLGQPGAGGGGGTISPSGAAQMEIRLNQLETEIRSLTGQVERFDFDLRQARERMNTLASDIDFRLSALEKRAGPAPAAKGEGQDPAADQAGPGIELGADAAAALPPGTPKEQYDHAKSLLRRADYEGAQRALNAFVETYPDGALTGNALYWLGETYYVRGDFSQAAIRFADGYKRFPDHAKGPDNLLKLGMSLAKLDKKREACASFSQITRQYPNATSVIRRTAATQGKKLGCR